MKQYEVNQKVWHIEINKANEEKSYRKNGIAINEYKIIGISKYKICINTDWFETFYIIKEGKRKEKYERYLDDTNVDIRTNNHILDDGIFINLYSTKKPTKKIIEKMVATASLKIDKDYGFLFKGLTDSLYDMVDEFKIELR